MKTKFFYPVIFVLTLLVSYGMMAQSQQMTEIEYQVLQQKAQELQVLHGPTVEVPYEPNATRATGDDCSNPIVIVASDGMSPWVTIGESTCGRVDDYDGTCMGLYDGGEDIIYELQVNDDMDLKFLFDPLQNWSAIAIKDACGNSGSCIVLKTGSSSAPREFQWSFTAGTYYIQVDSWPNPDCVDFDLTIEQYLPPPPPPPADPITTFPYTEDFSDCTLPSTMQLFAGDEAHAVVTPIADYDNGCGVMLDGNSFAGFFHENTNNCDNAFSFNYPDHTAQVKMNYTPNAPDAGALQLNFMHAQSYSFASYYSWFRVTVDGNVIPEENSGETCIRGNIDWQFVKYDLSAYQTPGQNYEIVLDFVGKYYYHYYNGGDFVWLDNIRLIWYDPTANPVAICQDITVPANANCEAEVTLEQINNGSYDPGNGEITLSLSPEGPYQLGETVVTLTVTNQNGATDECTAIITVEDNTPPVITTITSPIVIWPPNHKYVSFDVNDFVLSVLDNCASLTINDVNIIKATSDELEDATGSGDGNTVDDMIISGDCKSVQLRKERNATGNGRVYTVYLELDDGNGYTITASCQVHVPHNNGGTAIDDGAVYEVLAVCSNGPSFATGNKNSVSEMKLINYPNPFNSSTTFVFSVEEANKTTLKLYNSIGKEIKVLFDGYTEADQDYEIIFNGEGLPEGLYICHMQSGNEQHTRRILLVR